MMPPTRQKPSSSGMRLLVLGTLSLVISYWRWPASAARVLEPVISRSPKCLIYTHLQKSGGTTVKKVLVEWQRCRDVVFDNQQWRAGDASRDLFANNLVSSKGCMVVMGGYTEALRRTAVAQDECVWFTSFRHPVSRVVSAFFYCKKSPGDPLCASDVMPVEAHKDVIAFAKHWGNFGLRQFALAMVAADDVLDYTAALEKSPSAPKTRTRKSKEKQCGWYLLKTYLNKQASDAAGVPTAEDDVILADMLGPVQDLLRERYAAVGIVEEFNTTLSLFNAALGTATAGLDWHRAFDNSGVRGVDSQYKQEEMRVLAVASTSVELKSYIRLDLLLYEHAVAVFHEQARLHGVMS